MKGSLRPIHKLSPRERHSRMRAGNHQLTDPTLLAGRLLFSLYDLQAKTCLKRIKEEKCQI